MRKPIKEEDLSLLHIYGSILNNCTNKLASKFLIKRIYRILSKSFDRRSTKDFPKATYDLQLVYLLTNLELGKYAYAYLYSASLYHINEREDRLNRERNLGKLRAFVNKLKAYIGFK